MVVHGRVVLFLALSVSAWVQWGPVVRAQVRTDTTIVANVELVQIPVTIFDDKGAVAAHLKKNDFRLFDEGIEQNILYFERERVPVSFVVQIGRASCRERV